MDKFELKEMKRIRPIKNNWKDWLMNYIPEPMRKSVGGFKDKGLYIKYVGGGAGGFLWGHEIV